MNRTAELRRLQPGERALGGLEPVGCAHCRRAFLAPPGAPGQPSTGRREPGVGRPDSLTGFQPCPTCGAGPLEPQAAAVQAHPPEQLVPFDEAVRDRALAAFVTSTWFRAPDLQLDRLKSRATRIFWPQWLVDAAAAGTWSAEAGFDYEVVSSEERVSGGRATSTEVRRTKIRWEPRLGEVARRYDNVEVPARAEHPALAAALGEPAGAALSGFTEAALAGAWVALPDLGPEDAWDAARSGLTERMAEECRQAIGAPHLRALTPDVAWTDVNWTWRLTPLWTTWYTDGAGIRRTVWIGGTSGKTWGPALASRRLGWLVAGGLALCAAAAFGVGVVIALGGIMAWPLLILAVVVWLVGGVFAALAPLMPLWVWRHNARALRRFPMGQSWG